MTLTTWSTQPSERRSLPTERRYDTVTQLTIQHRESTRHIKQHQPVAESRAEKATKEIMAAYRKFDIANANPTRAIMNKTGVDLAQAHSLVPDFYSDWRVQGPRTGHQG